MSYTAACHQGGIQIFLYSQLLAVAKLATFPSLQLCHEQSSLLKRQKTTYFISNEVKWNKMAHLCEDNEDRFGQSPQFLYVVFYSGAINQIQKPVTVKGSLI